MKVENIERSQRSKETGQAFFSFSSHIAEVFGMHPCPQLTFGFLDLKCQHFTILSSETFGGQKKNDKISNFAMKMFDGN